MNKRFFLYFLIISSFCHLKAQNVGYMTMQDFVDNKFENIVKIEVEQRKWRDMMLKSGADFKISFIDNKEKKQEAHKRFIIIKDKEGSLYLNCNNLEYKSMKFGSYFAKAMNIGNIIFFSAPPLGSVAGSIFIDESSQKISGEVGDAIATSTLVDKRVCYELDCKTGKILFVDKERMNKLLQISSKLQQEYLKENDQTAKTTLKYLVLLKDVIAQKCLYQP